MPYFLTIMETGSVTKAAEVVRVAQPSLSRQLRGLEGTLGMTLFARGGKQMVLTAAGPRFLPLARDLAARADSVEAAVGALPAVPCGSPWRRRPRPITDVIARFLAPGGRGHPSHRPDR